MNLFPVYDASAPFIWAVYGLAAIIVGGMILRTLFKARAVHAALKATKTEDAA